MEPFQKKEETQEKADLSAGAAKAQGAPDKREATQESGTGEPEQQEPLERLEKGSKILPGYSQENTQIKEGDTKTQGISETSDPAAGPAISSAATASDSQVQGSNQGPAQIAGDQHDIPEKERAAEQKNEEPAKKRHTALAGFAIILLLGTALILAVYYHETASGSSTLNKNLNPNVKKDAAERIAAEDASSGIKNGTCMGYECFLEMFRKCEKASLSASLSSSSRRYYEILGPVPLGCKVFLEVLADSNKDILGKNMTCILDNRNSFNSEIADLSKCEGSLKDAMLKKKGGGSLGGSGGSGGSSGEGSGENAPEGTKRFLDIDITVSKDVYEVGEPVGPMTYKITNKGRDIHSKVSIIYSKIGIENTGNLLLDMDLPVGTTNIPEQNRAFNLTEITYRAPLNAFDDVGIYVFSMYVYDCEYLERELNVTDCSTSVMAEDLINLSYITKGSKSITVIEAE